MRSAAAKQGLRRRWVLGAAALVVIGAAIAAGVLARGSAAGPFGPIARRNARERLDQLVLPPGAQRLRVAPRRDGRLLHEPQATPGARQIIDLHRIWRVRGTLPSTTHFVEKRLPRVAHWEQRGSAGGPGTPPNELDAYYLPTGGGISVFFLDLAFVSLPHGWTGIRADALVGRCPCVHH